MSDTVLVRVWLRVAEPKAVTVLVTLFYASMIGLGVAVLISRTDPFYGVQAALLLSGGALAVTGCPFGQWWLERPGIIGLEAALGMHLIPVLAFPDRLDTSWAVTLTVFSMLFLAVRWKRLGFAPVDPRRRGPMESYHHVVG